MTGTGDGKLDAAVVAALYVEHADELRRFVRGLLRDPQLASDVLQATFVKMVEQGQETQVESRKAWLFRVAFHEAMAVRRRQQTGRRVLQQAAWQRPAVADAADRSLVRFETVQSVRAALEDLPVEQQKVVHKRIYEDKTFAQIARELQIPLGTVLWRMHAALKKLRVHLHCQQPGDAAGAEPDHRIENR